VKSLQRYLKLKYLSHAKETVGNKKGFLRLGGCTATLGSSRSSGGFTLGFSGSGGCNFGSLLLAFSSCNSGLLGCSRLRTGQATDMFNNINDTLVALVALVAGAFLVVEAFTFVEAFFNG
jgi:hypothetical protein